MFTRIKRKKNELLTYIMLMFVFIIIIFGGINIYKSCKIINNQANANFVFLTKDIKVSENDYFRAAEKEAELSKKIFEFTINHKELHKIAPNASIYNKYKIPYLGNYLESSVSPLLLYSAHKLKGIVSIYFIFDPDFIRHKDVIGLWYTDINNNGKFKLTNNGHSSEMYPENSPELEWFYNPKRLKKGVWSEPYVDKDIKIDMITYSTPIYSDNTFIGVMGVDISMEQIKKFIHQFKIYETGKAYLIDKNNKIIFAKDLKSQSSTKLIDKNLYDYLSKSPEKKGIKLNTAGAVLVKSASSKKLFAVTPLYNNFILVLEVPVKELYAETIKLIVFNSYLIILATLIVSLITIEANMSIKKINEELIHKEKLISMGTIVAEIAHEINNPIGFVNCNLDTLKKFIQKIKTLLCSYETALENILTKTTTIENEVENIEKLKAELKTDYVISSLDEIIDESKEGIDRVAEIVLNLKNFAKDDKQDGKSSENLEKIISEALTLFGKKITSDVEIIKVFGEIPPLLCHKNLLEQVVINLLDNANYSVKKKGHSNKKITVTTYKKGDNAYIEIEDNGLGIEKSKLNRIFDTFFSTKAQGEGTGLGLSIAYDIITKKHKGELLVESKKGAGARFIIKIPY